MKKTVLIRNYEAKDALYLEDIIRRTWQYDRFCSPKIAKRLSHIYLFNCLARQTFIRVAEYNGITIGVIMGKDFKSKPLHSYHLQRFWASLTLLSSREGRFVGKAFSAVDGVDEILLKKRNKVYQGELCFFAVDETCRSTGIGKTLFQALLQYMTEQKIQDFYLYTDSSCNYGFYEHQGMIRCGEQKYSVPIGMQNQMEFYLYEYQPGKTCL